MDATGNDSLLQAGKLSRLLELDAMRGIASMLVVLFHFTLRRPEAEYGFVLGITGVDLFFIISGFVIFMTLKNTKHWKDFVVSRFSRLFPAYWSCLVITTIFILIYKLKNGEEIIPVLKQFVYNISMIQYYFNVGDMDGSYWTLIIELLFYFVMLLVFLSKTLSKIEITGTLFLLLAVVYHFVFITNVKPVYELLNNKFPLINHFPLFFAGIVFFKMKFEKKTFARYILVTCCFALQCFLFLDGGRSNASITQLQYIGMLCIYFSIFLLYVHSLLSLFVNKVTVFLGTISYSLYLIHMHLNVKIIIPWLLVHTHFNYWIAAIGIALPLTLLIASSVTFFIEKPAMKYIRAKYKEYKINRGIK
jgi:peptidoglycan/LPS O-acetylase OafA/YrhL